MTTKTKKTPIRKHIIDYMKRSGMPLTADEIAAGIGSHFLSVRPRIAELKSAGKIKDSGSTKLGLLGKQAKLWETA